MLPVLAFVGEGLVLAAAIKAALGRGYRISGVLALAAPEIEALTALGVPVAGPDHSTATFLADHPCDILLSVANGRILTPADLAEPRIAAINYHNGPLPAYAGMWVTAWAVANGESGHGITWHRIDAGLDTGAVLVQRKFDLAPDETTATLNARCTAEAIAALDDLFALVASGNLSGTPQSSEGRSIYHRRDVSPDLARIDFAGSAKDIERLIRACDWGSAPSEFGDPHFNGPDGPVRILFARVVEGIAAPGTVLSTGFHRAVIACGEGALACELASFTTLRVGDEVPFSAPRYRPGVVDCLVGQALEDPEAPAIEDADGAVSRGKLLASAAAVAEALQAAGLKPGDAVGLHVPAGRCFVVSALAAMMARCAYVPLSVLAPPARREREIASADIAIVLHDRDGPDLPDLPEGVDVLNLEDIQEAAELPSGMPCSTDCAYRIFTSGSSGSPKAVGIDHAALGNLIEHYRANLGLTPRDRMTFLASTTFDASVADIWPILAAGGVLVVPPQTRMLDGGALRDWMLAKRITVSFVPPVVAGQLVEFSWPSDTALRYLLTGGDVLWQRPPPGLPFTLVNTYGPTENTVDSLWAAIGPGEGIPVIGRPISGVTASIRQHDGTLVPSGRADELWLGGRQLAIGYHAQPDLTERAFVKTAEGRFYRTGDKARISRTGDYEFHGRIDAQLQVLGHRVEPGEIESLARVVTGVTDAVCLPIRQANTVIGLSLHIVPDDPQLVETVSRALAHQLPAALVPRQVIAHRRWPLTAAGKVDRKQLEGLASATPSSDGDLVRNLWRAALCHDADSADNDSFWDLGGDSLRAVDLLLAIEQATGLAMPIGIFLADPTLGGICSWLQRAEQPELVRIAQGAGTPVVLFYGLDGDLGSYRDLIEALPGRTIIGLRSPGFVAAMPATMEQAAASALATLEAEGVDDDAAFIGFSFGGIVAFEAARQRTVAGRPPRLLALIDSHTVFGTLTRAALARRLAGAIGQLVAGALLGRFALSAMLRMGMSKLALRSSGASVAPHLTDTSMKRHHFDLIRRYRPDTSSPVELVLFRGSMKGHGISTIALRTCGRRDFYWGDFTTCQPDVVMLEASHLEIVRAPAAQVIGDAIIRAVAT